MQRTRAENEEVECGSKSSSQKSILSTNGGGEDRFDSKRSRSTCSDVGCQSGGGGGGGGDREVSVLVLSDGCGCLGSRSMRHARPLDPRHLHSGFRSVARPLARSIAGRTSNEHPSGDATEPSSLVEVLPA